MLSYLKNAKKAPYMTFSYKKLWKLLIDRDMTRTDLRTATGISSCTLAKMSKGEGIAMNIVAKICTTLKCDVGDIMEVLSYKNDANADK